MINLNATEYINFGKFTADNSIFKQQNIQKLTSKFLDIQYVANTMDNDAINTANEKLVIDFDALDCFTFIDTIEALKLSQTKQEFKKKLIQTRYKDAEISYFNRNHFFSDWVAYNEVKDITCTLGQCKTTTKFLNKDEKYLKQIPTVKRDISYISSNKIDISLLNSGDYIGIYTDKKALDVTHTGVIIKKHGKVFIRHASSLEKKVIDSELYEYTKDKIGVIVYRSSVSS